MIADPDHGAVRRTRRVYTTNRCTESLAVPCYFTFVPWRHPILGRSHELFQVRGVPLVIGEVRVLGKDKLSQIRAGRLETILGF